MGPAVSGIPRGKGPRTGGSGPLLAEKTVLAAHTELEPPFPGVDVLSSQGSLADSLQGTWEQPCRSAAASEPLTSRDYAATVQLITELGREDEEEDRPSEFALGRTLSVLEQAARELRLSFPLAIVAVGPHRSLRLLWSSEGREVRLVVGGSTANKTYLYWEGPGQRCVDYSVDGARLASLLRWTLHGI